MSVGFIILCHASLDRAAQVARHLTKRGCPVVIHVDRRVDKVRLAQMQAALADLPHIRFAPQYRCDWGTWSITQATQAASELMLEAFPEVRHVYLASGSCLPLRPVEELVDYLTDHPQTDFIESVDPGDAGWAVGGFDIERFTLRFPFKWKTQRRLFDRYVELQRWIGLRRRMPKGITPHLGAQWWCLTRQTLSAILSDPNRAVYDRYFSRVWIPDEAYFQTLVRLYSSTIESRSLTLGRFDDKGKPYVFYDDHLDLLRQSDCFMARKAWPHANRLYEAFLQNAPARPRPVAPDAGKIDRLVRKAFERREHGRPGLYMQSRFPRDGFENVRTAAPYSVLEGFTDLFDGFETWLTKTTGAQVHGHLFAPEAAAFAGGETMFAGALSNSAVLRDYNPKAFLTNLIWTTRGARQCFQFGPKDAQQIGGFLAWDANAHISVISGTWAVPLYHSNRNFADIRAEAARLQKIEADHIAMLRAPGTKATVRVWSLAEFVEAPVEALQTVIGDIMPKSARRLAEAPLMHDLGGFGQFLQNLRNHGMQPTLTGEFPTGQDPTLSGMRRGKPYLVR